MKKPRSRTSGFAKAVTKTDDGEQRGEKAGGLYPEKSTHPMDTGSPGARSRLFFPPATCVDRKSCLPHVSRERARDDAPVFQTVSSHQDGVLHRLPCQKPRKHRLRNMSSIGPGSKT